MGFGYDICQPDSDGPASIAGMHNRMEGSEREFLLPKSTSCLRSTGCDSRTTRGRQSSLHSHLREAFALDWAVYKNRAKLWGIRFTAFTDYPTL